MRSPVKGNGKINESVNLVMGKVKILKRGESLTDFEKSGKNTVSFDVNEVVLKRGKTLSEKTKKKTVSFDENEVILKRGKALSEKIEKKTLSFDENDVVLKRGKALSEKMEKEKKTASFDEKEVTLRCGKALSDFEKTEKKTVSFDEKVVVKENEDSKRNDVLESIEMLKRLGPEPDMVPKKINLIDFYAGSGCFISPDPRTVPVPDFCKSSQLRRLLNLSF